MAEQQQQQQQGGKRVRQKQRVGFQRRLLLLALLLSVGALAALSLGALANSAQPVPTPVLTPEPSPVPTPEPTPVQESDVVEAPAAAYDFSLPAPETLPVDDDYFSDAVFLGDSRSDGLRLYSGIRGADFLAYKSLMVFQVTGTGGVDRKVIPMNGNGEKATVLDALDKKQYGKVYIMFGVNELGYRDDEGFHDAFVLLVDEVRQRQPDAVIYIQSLVPVNPEKAHKTNPADWLNNDKIAAYNDILRQVAEETHVVYVDVQESLVDDTGTLPAEGTTDGIHFTKTWYKTWYEYLKTHTVEKASYDRGELAVGNT